MATAFGPIQHSAVDHAREASYGRRIARLGVSHEALAGMLRQHGEDVVAERALSLSDDELARVGTLGAYYAFSEDAMALGGSIGGARALSLAAIDVLEDTGRDLRWSRSEWERPANIWTTRLVRCQQAPGPCQLRLPNVRTRASTSVGHWNRWHPPSPDHRRPVNLAGSGGAARHPADVDVCDTPGTSATNPPISVRSMIGLTAGDRSCPTREPPVRLGGRRMLRSPPLARARRHHA